MTQQALPPTGTPAPWPGGAPAAPPSPPFGMPQAPIPGHGPPAGLATPPTPPRTNGLAIGAFVAAFLAPLLGLILGIVARRRTVRTGEGGRGLATAAIVIGSVLTALGLLFGVLVGVAVANASHSAPADKVAAEIASKGKLPPGSVTCPGPLADTPGTTMTCTVATPEGPIHADATVTSTDSGSVRFDITFRR